MTCNRCGREMTKETRNGTVSWWCPYCGNIETMYSDKNHPPEKDPKIPHQS